MHQQLMDYLDSMGQGASDRRCVYCKRGSDATMFLCGHPYCKSCLANQCLATPLKTPIKCACCDELVYIKNIKDALSKAQYEKFAAASAASFLLSDDTQPLCLCVDECTGLLEKSKGYQHCVTCNQGVCPLCHAVDAEAHDGCTCEEFRRNRETAKLFELDTLFKDARKFVDDNWGTSMSSYPVQDMFNNPGLLRGCPSMQRYCKTIVASGKVWQEQDTMFAWHGTSGDAVRLICHNGFDPSYRSGQAYGPGEYFGQAASTSHGYCRSGFRMIVAQIIRTERFSTHGTFCYVVNNPCDFSSADNLPVLVVAFRNPAAPGYTVSPPNWIEEAPQSLPFRLTHRGIGNKFSLHDSESSEMTTEEFSRCMDTQPSFFEWQWRDDDRKFYPYREAQTKQLESAYNEWKHCGGPSVVTLSDTKARSGNLRDTLQTYEVFFSENRIYQRNTSNSTMRQERDVTRQLATLPPANRVWQFCLTDTSVVSGAFQSYESVYQSQIDALFTAYVSGKGRETVTTRFEPLPDDYTLNFAAMTQTNASTGKCRLIRHLDASSPHLVSLRLPPGANLYSFAQGLPQIEADLAQQVLDFVGPGADSDSEATKAEKSDILMPQLKFNTTTAELRILLRGPSKKLASTLVAYVTNVLDEKYGVVPLMKRTRNCGAAVINERLLQLSQRQPPEMPDNPSRNDYMRLLAHTLIWDGGCSIYGGMVRDWVVRNEDANDIDC
ncbi:hypothetical protein KIPB_011995, partial [Kipferlia bialata]|eukprot:g11995.t1